jgi:preprotein translocase subunit YajC
MGSSPLSTILLIALMVVAFYFLLLRPQKKRQQAQQKTMNEIQSGTRVLLGSGIFGTVVTASDKQAVIEIAPGVQLTVLKQAIARIVQPGDEFSEPAEFESEIEDESVIEPEPIDPQRKDPEPTRRESIEPDTRTETPTYENPSFGNEPKKD